MSRLGAALFLALAASAALGQPAGPTWIGAGAGVSVVLDDQTGLWGFGASYVRPVGKSPWAVRVGGRYETEFTFFSEPESFSEVHVALGATSQGGPVVGLVSLGPSLGYGRWEREGTLADGEGVLPGMIGSVQVLAVVRPVAFGVDVYAHYNARLPVVGMRFVLAGGHFP